MTRRAWPYGGAASSPAALTVSPDTTLNSARPLAGPLRRGTAPGVGPRGVVTDAFAASDFGLDRMGERRFDPMGDSRSRQRRR